MGDISEEDAGKQAMELLNDKNGVEDSVTVLLTKIMMLGRNYIHKVHFEHKDRKKSNHF